VLAVTGGRLFVRALVVAAMGRFGILNDFIQSNTCSLFDDFLSGINGMTDSDVGSLSAFVGIAYLEPLLNRLFVAERGKLLTLLI
jgi:hypothetical protein